MAHITENDILFWAVETGNQPVLEALYRSKKVMDIHKARDKYDRTLLMRAAESGQDKIVSFLLDKVQMHVNGVNDKQETALMWGATHPNHKVVSRLLAHWADVEQADNRGVTPLMVAAMNGHVKTIDELLNSGAKIDKSDKQGKTALIYAIQSKNLIVVEHLLSKGADVNKQDMALNTPAMHATQAFMCSFFSEISDINVDFRNIKDILSVLVKYGANLNAQDINGNTILHHEVLRSQIFIPFLMKNGAKKDVPNYDGKLPEDVYYDVFHKECSSLFDKPYLIAHYDKKSFNHYKDYSK